MRIGIFYLSFQKRWGSGHHKIMTPSGRRVYIRVEEVDVDGLEEALDKARPHTGEWLMNTHPLPAK